MSAKVPSLPNCLMKPETVCGRKVPNTVPPPDVPAAAAGSICRLSAITKIDILTGYEKLPVCVRYRINGKEYDTIPASLRDYAAAEPVYRYFDGWTEDISRIREFDKLPENCRKYVRFIEEYCGCSVSLVSVGPDREENIILRKII